MQREMLNSFAMVAAVILLAVGGPWLAREVRTLPRAHALAARADQRIVTLEVGGMTCAGCAAKVKGELASLHGVSVAEVRLAQRQAYVVCDKSVPDSALTGAIHRAGPGFLAAVATR
jgi:copper chaperone CopZ